MTAGMELAIKDGKSTSFFTDRWLGNGECLADHVLPHSDELEEDQCVASFVQSSGDWDLERMRNFLPEEMVLRIAGVQPPRPDAGEDLPIWGPESDGRFRIRTAYDIASSYVANPQQGNWKTVWKWQGPAKIRYFLWLATRGRLLTNSERKRRHLSNSDKCSNCEDEVESVVHVIRDCGLARQVWCDTIEPGNQPAFFAAECNEWQEDNLSKPEFSLRFGATCWAFWKARNERVFKGKATTKDGFMRRINEWLVVIRSAMEKDQALHHTPAPPQKTAEIAWTPPPRQWIAINCDGSVLQNSGVAFAGGLLRDHGGRCLGAFACNLGICSITTAELRGAVMGLQAAWDDGYRKVQLQLDSQVAVHLLQDKNYRDHAQAGVLSKAQELLSRQWDVDIIHIYREGNKCADFLANLGHTLDIELHCIPIDPSCLSHLILYDGQGLSEPRSILIN
ncbi:unnamed protein product [Linum trigynum]|uniref:RNase H type-1 domain-containing protein n=1 Tax=Linum trigynum TaxID=586398 RepID=A0AAV2CQB7_9ROSI